MDDNKMLFDLLKEVREDQKRHGEELAKQSVCLNNMEAHVEKNTKDLAYHIHRTDVLEDLHKDNQGRIKENEKKIGKLEEPIKAKKYLKEHWKFWLGIAAAIAGIASKIAGMW